MKDTQRKGPEPLPKYEEKTRNINDRMQRIGLSKTKLWKLSKVSKLSFPNFCAKMRGHVGWHDSEIANIEKIIKKKEDEIISGLVN